MAPAHFDRGHIALKFAIAVGEKTPSLVNLLKRNRACAAREDVVRRYFGIDPIRWSNRLGPPLLP
jgi:hypothetical protein